MRWAQRYAATAVDAFAAVILACAVAFAASVLANGLAAALLAPLAFSLAFAGLGRIDAVEPHSLAAFDLARIDAPQDPVEEANDNVVRLFDPRQLAIARPSAASPRGVTDTRLDAGQALSDALAQLKRSLR